MAPSELLNEDPIVSPALRQRPLRPFSPCPESRYRLEYPRRFEAELDETGMKAAVIGVRLLALALVAACAGCGP
ncbi:MAG: hypothetical protein AB1566_14815, partial [Chloroflexota bacterium]